MTKLAQKTELKEQGVEKFSQYQDTGDWIEAYRRWYREDKLYTGDGTELFSLPCVVNSKPGNSGYHQGWKDNTRCLVWNLMDTERMGEILDVDLWVAVPKKKLKEGGRYKGDKTNHRRLFALIDDFQMAGYIQVCKGYSKKNGDGEVTKIKLTPDGTKVLDSAIEDLVGNTTCVLPDEPIIQKDKNKALFEYEDCDYSNAARNEIEDIKQAVNPILFTLSFPFSFSLSSSSYSYSPDIPPSLLPLPVNGEQIPPLKGPKREKIDEKEFFLTNGEQIPPQTVRLKNGEQIPPQTVRLKNGEQIPPRELKRKLHDKISEKCAMLRNVKPKIDWQDEKIIYHLDSSFLIPKRVYNRCDWGCGGRFYARYQQIPSGWRQFLSMDGEPLVERDYASLHPHMLYHLENVEPEWEDAYDIDLDVPRKVLKIIWNVILNSGSYKCAYERIKSDIRKNDIDLAGYEPKEIFHAFYEKHADIKKYFCSDVGIRLQKLDAQIAERILEDHPHWLCVHDSFLCPKSEVEELEKVMVDEYQNIFGYDIGVEPVDPCEDPLGDLFDTPESAQSDQAEERPTTTTQPENPDTSESGQSDEEKFHEWLIEINSPPEKMSDYELREAHKRWKRDLEWEESEADTSEEDIEEEEEEEKNDYSLSPEEKKKEEEKNKAIDKFLEKL